MFRRYQITYTICILNIGPVLVIFLSITIIHLAAPAAVYVYNQYNMAYADIPTSGLISNYEMKVVRRMEFSIGIGMYNENLNIVLIGNT